MTSQFERGWQNQKSTMAHNTKSSVNNVNLSAYADSLSEEAKTRYKIKLLYNRGTCSLPDPYHLTEKWGPFHMQFLLLWTCDKNSSTDIKIVYVSFVFCFLFLFFFFFLFFFVCTFAILWKIKWFPSLKRSSSFPDTMWCKIYAVWCTLTCLIHPPNYKYI